jgi:hypothetical protein
MKEMISNILEGMAKEKGISVRQLRADMIVAIHAATLSENPDTRRRFFERFNGHEPTPEEFISTMAFDAAFSAGIIPTGSSKYVS